MTEERYEPGPSFVDDEDLEVDPADLPPWLRDMTQTPPEGVAATSVVPSEEALPEWLRAARSDGPSTDGPASAERSAPPAAAPAQDFSLIGEEDLPEWLRALSDDDAPSEPSTAPEPVQGSSPTPPVSVTVPTVSRAWLARPRAVDESDAASARQEFAPLVAETRLAAAPRQVEPVASATPAVAAETKTTPAVEPPSSADIEAARRTRRIRILILLLAIAVLALLLVTVIGDSGTLWG